MSVKVLVPLLGEGVEEVTVMKWLKQEGDSVKELEPLLEVNTDKVDTEIPSPVSGVLRKIICPVGAKVPIHTVVAIVDDSAAAPDGAEAAAAPPKPAPAPPPAPVSPPAPPSPAPAAVEEGKRVFSSPLVRRIAQQEGVDLSAVEGTGWKGRVTRKDIEEFLARKGGEAPSSPPPPVPAPAPVPPAPAPPRTEGPAGRVQVVPMSPMRVKIAEHMVMSRRTSAHVATVFEVDVTRVVELREREKQDFETVYGTRLTFTPFFAMACLQGIKDFPILNASVEGTSIVYRRNINLGIAVALPDGLIVPVVRNAEEKSFLGLSRAVNDLAERARGRKLTVEDVQGGTFTITNPGIYGGLFGTPIINQPQVAILGIGGIEKRPVVVNDAIAVRSMCYLCLSFDHRVIDGAVADQFMSRVKEVLQGWTIPIR